jgi:predicted ArsR family transcriptional regulator
MNEHSDSELISLLRGVEWMTVSQLSEQLKVTATAVRHRLNRLMGQQLVQRRLERGGRGRPSHVYSLTDQARRQAGNNFADLATVLWEEIDAIKDPGIRRGLLKRISKALAVRYAKATQGGDLRQRLEAVARLFDERGVTMTVDTSGELPVLNMEHCPYPGLAEQDRGVCSAERMMFSELLDEDVHLAQCRLDGHAFCQFQTR